MMASTRILINVRMIAQMQKNAEFKRTISWLEGMTKRANIYYRRNTKVPQKLPPDAADKIEEFTR